MKIKITLLAVLITICSSGSIIATDNLGLISPSSSWYISDGATHPTWYVPVLRNSPVTFTASPSPSLTSLTWVFTNGTLGTGTGNGPLVIKYDQTAGEGVANSVTFTSVRNASGVTCTTTAKPLLKVVLIDMQYGTTSGNFSTDPSNAIVRLKNAHYPTKIFNLPCQIRISAANTLPSNLTVCLVNPDGRLGFSLSGDATNSTQAVTLPKTGAWVNFNVSGQSGSSLIGDAVLEVHKDSATGAKLGQNTMTVYHYDSNVMKVTAGNDYSYSGGVYTVTPPSATYMEFSSNLTPNGLSLTAAQLTNIVIGLVQNCVASTLIDAAVYSSPTISWYGTTPSGTTVTPPIQWGWINQMTVTSDDAGSPGPLYTLSHAVLPSVNGSPITGYDNDTPHLDRSGYLTYVTTAWYGMVPVGTLTYALSGIEIKNNFVDDCVTYDTNTGEVIPLEQNTWTSDDVSSLTSQTITPGTAGAPSSMPVITTPYSNFSPPQSASYAASPTTTTFTK